MLENGFSSNESAPSDMELKIGTVTTDLTASIEAMGRELTIKLDDFKNELSVGLGRKIEALKWILGVLITLKIAILIRLMTLH